eukprot:4767031-Lingulodinium_polyedra.AAC.1
MVFCTCKVSKDWHKPAGANQFVHARLCQFDVKSLDSRPSTTSSRWQIIVASTRRQVANCDIIVGLISTNSSVLRVGSTP